MHFSVCTTTPQRHRPLHRRGTDDITHVFWSTTWNDVKPWCGKTNPKWCFTMLHMFSYSLAFHAVPMCKHWSCSLVGSNHRWWCLSMVGHFHCSVEIFNLDSWPKGKSSIWACLYLAPVALSKLMDSLDQSLFLLLSEPALGTSLSFLGVVIQWLSLNGW